MAIHEIPRNVKGEGRILMIFSTKSLIYTCVTGGVGLIFYYLFGSLMGLTWLGIGIALIFAAIGFVVGTFKIPDTNGTEITRKLGGEDIDKAFLRWLKFKKKNNVIYTYLGTDEEGVKE